MRVRIPPSAPLNPTKNPARVRACILTFNVKCQGLTPCLYFRLLIPVENWNESMKIADAQIENYREEGVLFGGVTIGQIVGTINLIYSDPRTKTMEIIDIMPFVSGRLIQGWTKKELDEVIAITIQIKRCEIENGLIGKVCGELRKRKNKLLAKLRNKPTDKNNLSDNSSCASNCREMYYSGKLKKGITIKQCINEVCN